MGDKRPRTLADYVRFEADAAVRCLHCGRTIVAEPRALAGRLGPLGLTLLVDELARRMKCVRCGQRGARIIPTPACVDRKRKPTTEA